MAQDKDTLRHSPPWGWVLLGMIFGFSFAIVLALVVFFTGVAHATTPVSSSFVLPATITIAPLPTLVPTPTRAPTVQTMEQPVVVPAVSNPVVVNYHVEWTKVEGFDPSTIPVEEGFYSGLLGSNLYFGTNSGDVGGAIPPELKGKLHSNLYMDVEVPGYGVKKLPVPVRARYAWRILPHLEGLPAAVAAARDQADTDIVFVSFEADRYGAYILLSVDGEESWCMLNLLPAYVWRGKLADHGDAVATRVVALGEEIHLYGEDPRSGNHWWTATVDKNTLPCS